MNRNDKMLTNKEIGNYLVIKSTILNRIQEVAKPNSTEISIKQERAYCGDFSIPIAYLYNSDVFVLDSERVKKEAREAKILGIKKANAIEGYKENLELVELSKKELVELGIDPDTIKVDE